ncbi:MAG: protein containing YHS domain protein [Chloroflexota bacterium]|nr:protein containing YHS domain protein [Chloroflexota bacterium]
MRETARLTYGVMGSASGKQSKESLRKLTELGRAIAERGHIVITGACPGLPYAAARGAQAAGGLSIGISPGLSLDEHVHKYNSPTDAYDVLIYTGSGLMGREVLNIHSSDMVVIAAGRSGTLGEFAIAFDEGRLIGVLTGTGGIADRVPDLIEMCDKDTGAAVLYDDDPTRLVERLAEYYLKQHKAHPSVFFPSLPGENLALPEAHTATKRARPRN